MKREELYTFKELGLDPVTNMITTNDLLVTDEEHGTLSITEAMQCVLFQVTNGRRERFLFAYTHLNGDNGIAYSGIDPEDGHVTDEICFWSCDDPEREEEETKAFVADLMRRLNPTMTAIFYEVENDRWALLHDMNNEWEIVSHHPYREDALDDMDPEDLETYVVASNTAVTCIVTAESEQAAVAMAEEKLAEELGCEEDLSFDAYEIGEYFSSEYEPGMFGWVVSKEDNYLEGVEMQPCSEKMREIYQRTLNNCRYYKKEEKMWQLMNEIGVLRGIMYAAELENMDLDVSEAFEFIGIQQELRKNDEK